MTNDVDGDVQGFDAFWTVAVALKRTLRQGWVDCGVLSPESVADHSWGVALLAWLAARGRSDLNRDRVLLLGLVHDLPEALTGDMTPFDFARADDGRISPERFSQSPVYSQEAAKAKHTAEEQAMSEITAMIPGALGDELRSAWREYDAQQTDEARFVKQIDKLETLLQSQVYAVSQPEIVVESFRLGALRDVRDERLRKLGRLSEPEPDE